MNTSIIIDIREYFLGILQIHWCEILSSTCITKYRYDWTVVAMDISDENTQRIPLIKLQKAILNWVADYREYPP
jgi:hypothetical protein